VALFALPSGLLADRLKRKMLMIAADVIRAAAVVALVVTIATSHVEVWMLIATAFIEGAGMTLFLAASSGALRAVVPRSQLPTAAATATGREAAVTLVGPPLGGALFALARVVPFAVDAGSYLFSTISLLAMRTPFEPEREPDLSTVRERLVEGLRYLWDQKFMRTCAMLFGLANFIIPGLLFTVVVLADRRGLSGGEVGALVATFGAALLLGAGLSSFVRRHLSVRAVLLLELWTYLAVVVFLVWPNVYVLAASLLPTALAIPSTDSVVHGYRIAMTPEHLLGRAESVRTSISLLIAPLGPLLAGILLSSVSPRTTVAVFFGFSVIVTGWGVLSPSIRDAPNLDDLLD
jgi:predicted MFS family arabinose efflux permease